MTARAGSPAAKQLGPEANPAQTPLFNPGLVCHTRHGSAIPIAGR